MRTPNVSFGIPVRAFAKTCVVALAFAGCAESTARPTTSPSLARDALAQLAVSEASPEGYERARFGPAWADVDRNGCDTRNDTLNRDLTNRQWRAGTRRCVVVEGDLADPYTGARVHFVKADADEVQIDHVVALSNAWDTGAASWSDPQRREFANDPLNLLAVTGDANQAKGDDDAGEWLPPDADFHCEYVARQVAVKVKWRLTVTLAEREAIASVLARCPDVVVPG
jgi:hypothetical protein